MQSDLAHYIDCHPEDDHGPDAPEGYEPQYTEQCWHCATSTDMGCYCLDCVDNAHLIPPGNVYHCRRCGRWWAYMTGLNITTITIEPLG